MRYVEFLDIDAPYSGALGRIEFDPFLAAVASLKTIDGQPMVSHWIDPKPELSIEENGATKLRNAVDASILTSVSGTDPLNKTTAINGQPTFTVNTTGALGQGDAEDVRVDEWSMIAVHDLLPTVARNDVFGIGGGLATGVELYPGLEVNITATNGDGQIISREGGTTTRRIVRNFTALAGTPCISSVTFSTDLGFSVFKNNFEGFFRDDSDKRALTDPTFTYLANRSGNSQALGDFGMAFILRADISRPEYAWARQILLGGLMSKYGITSS
ncbi:hypothetical protein [Stutzerimonas xanthomarina]|uniref:hypothetical protein n=1 Tax=Stutzerimonas xanthomarina TaxID=271420 RepID=UPI003AA7B600